MLIAEISLLEKVSGESSLQCIIAQGFWLVVVVVVVVVVIVVVVVVVG